jgi:hypothetical protein
LHHLRGFDASTASIDRFWAVDNEGIEVRLNGSVVPGLSLLGEAFSNFQQLNPLSITAGFIPGLNTLEFIVRNGDIVGGFRAELSGVAQFPVPGALLLFGTGLLSIGAAQRFKRSRKRESA